MDSKNSLFGKKNEKTGRSNVIQRRLGPKSLKETKENGRDHGFKKSEKK